MKRNLSLDLSMLALSALTALIIPSSAALGSSACLPSSNGFVTSSIKADTLTAVAGTEVPLRVSLENAGADQLRGGSVAIIVAREPRQGDFSQGNYFIVTRSVVKTGVSLEANSSANLSFAWNIPAYMPEGVYRADAIFLKDGRAFEDATVVSGSPFGNSAKMLISSDVSGALFFIAELTGDGNDAPKIALFNGTKEDVNLPVTIKTYSGGVDGNLVKSESINVASKAGSLTIIPYDTANMSRPFSLTAEAMYKGVPAFYMYSSEGSAGDCSDDNILYSWAMLIGGLGVIMLVLAHLKEKRT